MGCEAGFWGFFVGEVFVRNFRGARGGLSCEEFLAMGVVKKACEWGEDGHAFGEMGLGLFSRVFF